MKLTDRLFPDETFYREELCERCGVCCGSTDGDPCRHLRQDSEGKYYCEVYAKRFGKRKSVQGMAFYCVRIQKVIEAGGGYAGCAYVREIKRLREERGEPTDDLGAMRNPLG